MKVNFISEPEWAEGREVTLMPDTYNITGLNETQYGALVEAAKRYANGSNMESMRVALMLSESQIITD